MAWKTINEGMIVHYPQFTLTGSIKHETVQASLAHIDAVSSEEEILSVNPAAYVHVPGPGEVFVKAWSEHQGFAPYRGRIGREL